MVRGSADKRQPGGDIHPIIKSKQLERNMPLIVIHRHHHIVHAFVALHEDGVRRARSDNMDTLRLHGGNRWGDDTDFFIAEQTVFTGVRVHSGYRDARLRIPHAA